MLQLIFSLKVFDLIWVMTQGGPASSSHVLGTLLYDQAFRLHRFGYASTIAVTTSVLIIGIAAVYLRLVRSASAVTT
jgi:ABC-type sugar transport system permease subunit